MCVCMLMLFAGLATEMVQDNVDKWIHECRELIAQRDAANVLKSSGGGDAGSKRSETEDLTSE